MSLRIYTRTGDDGSTGIFGGRRVSKCDDRIEAVGDVDELNAAVGFACCGCHDEDLLSLLRRIQNDLFSVGADLATPAGDPGKHGAATVSAFPTEPTARLEAAIDRLEADLPPLRNFVLPGGTELAARFHLCRAVCRRAERRVVAFSEREATNPEILRYLNRLSDLLFVLARTANRREAVADVPWKNDGSSQ